MGQCWHQFLCSWIFIYVHNVNSDLSLSLVSEVCVCEHQLKQRIKYIIGTISVLAYNDDVFFVGGDIWWQKNIVLNELSMEAMD